jgi:hypothetical protein
MGEEGGTARPEPGSVELAARRKLHNLLEGHFLLYELTGDRQMRVLRLPRRLTPREGSGDRASRRAGGGAPPAA